MTLLRTFPVAVAALLCVGASNAQAQKKAPVAARAPASKVASKVTSVLGTWIGTATVQLGDSTITVPVTYNFTQSGAAIGGTAMVPGQGTGPISNVVRDGTRIQFRVTAPENRLLEHDGTVAADGSSMEGMVNFNNAPIAKFKITFKK